MKRVWSLPEVLTLVGVLSLVVAGFLVSMPLGFAVLGACCVIAAYVARYLEVRNATARRADAN